MTHATISVDLWTGAEIPHAPATIDFVPTIDLFPAASAKSPRGAVIVLPGGGYSHRAPHEGEPIARAMNAAGMHAAVVQYRVAPNRHPAPLLDIARSVRLLRANTWNWNLDGHRIAVLGFSAGGHLAASLSVFHHRVPAVPGDLLAEVNCRPDASVLCYPVICTNEFTHRRSYDNLLGPAATKQEREEWAPDLGVDGRTPPAFIWHTAEDPDVPVENSLAYATALSRCRIPFEMHIYPNGRHGLGLAGELPGVATWMSLCCRWLVGQGW